MAIMLVSNYIRSFLGCHGAFEIYLNGDILLHSRLQTGCVPSSLEIQILLKQQGYQFI
jgi:hypothetical protein